jgi:hypothetical protein
MSVKKVKMKWNEMKWYEMKWIEWNGMEWNEGIKKNKGVFCPRSPRGYV